MDKTQTLHEFWSGFGIPAYDEQTVPDDAGEKYITYSVATDSIGNVVNLTASIWDINTNSWDFVDMKAEEIAKAIAEMYPAAIKMDKGRLFLAKGNPFAQRMSDPSSDLVRRIYLNVQAEFLTAY